MSPARCWPPPGWPALNFFFGSGGGETQTAQLRAALGRIPAGHCEVWVTRQVNMTALTGAGITMGEGLVIDARGKMVVRSTFG